MTDSLDNAAVPEALHARAIETLARAFHADLALQWMFPDEASRPRRLERFFAWVMLEHAQSGLILTGDACDAVTLWRPPGQQQTQRPRSLRELFTGFGIFGTRLGRAMQLAEAINQHLPSGRDFLYLQFAAVHPTRQGRGLGPRTILKGLALADQQGVPTYLETTSASNVVLYRQLGFEVVHQWQVPRGGPVFWTMMRPAP